MGESVVADFVGRVHTADVAGNEPVAGRVLLSQRRLVLATDEVKTTVPLSSVFDVAVGTVPGDLQSFFSDTVTVAYTDGNARRTAVVEGNPEPMERFTTVLFKALLHDVTASVRHPAKVGGRVTDEPDQRAAIKLGDGELSFVGCREPFSIDLSTVVDYERLQRTLDGETRPTLSVRHVPEGSPVTSLVTVSSERTLNVIGRYVKLEYGEVMEEVYELDPTEEELQILVTLYTADGDVTVSDIVTGDATRASMVLEGLRDRGLVVDGEGGPTLTPKGQMVVSTYLESVNG
ncbi:Component of chemotaxis system associated with archaellum, contains CheF-like and HTH domain [Halalkaliarchaeum sp. AArc-CO]|uniref:CheF family chemotaxis protein n=1 Tax=Halalkaliarchaeum sp. AArc-CO TaxID=2866381 RepID=UPI00217F00D8|nr:CheF family chemotaxis protein [Halalkaliarchaeum sp. AArc-CO]UWG52240.1 Component of chemotaxis system associated with archaellum, contains CheF-like and HTH domain [Halalkaliarchaeum sp. AArc-CO]